MMGCGKSFARRMPLSKTATNELTEVEVKKSNQNLLSTSIETISEAYLRIDGQVIDMESKCIAPRLATAEAWFNYIQTSLDTRESKTKVPNNELFPEADSESIESTLNVKNIEEQIEIDRESIKKLALQLNVSVDIKKANKNEEFIANVSRKYLSHLTWYLKSELLNYTKNRIQHLQEEYNKLQADYLQLDGLIESITSGQYASNVERLYDTELETLRQLRDKLGGVSEQWRTSSILLRTSVKEAYNSLEFWNLVEQSRVELERISLAFDCRNALQSSLVALEAAQNVLPQVDLAFISPRQITAIEHANIYLLTDMANQLRYNHTKNVLEAYEINVTKSLKWLYNTYHSTIKENLETMEKDVKLTAEKLRQERLKKLPENIGQQIYVNS